MDNIEVKSEGTLIGRAVRLDRIFESLWAKAISLILIVLGITSGGLIIFHYLVSSIGLSAGFAYIFFALFLVYLACRSFYFSKVRNPRVTPLRQLKVKIMNGSKVNLYDSFSFDLALALSNFTVKKNANLLDLIKYLGDAHDLAFVLSRLGISGDDLAADAKAAHDAETVSLFLRKALDIAIRRRHEAIESSDLFSVLVEEGILDGTLKDLKIDHHDVENVIYWYDTLDKEERRRHDLLDPANLRFTGGIGRDWSFGYTPFLRQFSADITATIQSQGLSLDVIGREKEIQEIEDALLREDSANVIVVGEEGIGKRTTILGFAKKVIDGTVSPSLAHHHIFQVDIDALFAGATGGPDEVADRLSQILTETSFAGNVIIFIENIDNLFTNGTTGQVDLSEVILPYLDSGTVSIIGTSSVKAYNDIILTNPALTQRFIRVGLSEPEGDNLIRILEDVVPAIEYKSGAFVSYEAIKEAIHAADKYILNQPDPEKTISLLDGAISRAVSERGETIVEPKDITAYITDKLAIPTIEVTPLEKTKLLNLEKEMHVSVIGQDEAIKAIANALRRSRAQVSDTRKPIGSFLFLGPTGVGKTATAKALAQSYFGSQDNMIRFDMSEYQNPADIYRLIGEGKTAGELTKAIAEKPFSLILFDEIEKADPEILNLLLQVLDEGILTDGDGKKVSFASTIIIATSNAGANLIRESIQSGEDYEQTKKTLVNSLIQDSVFRPEWINRFTAVVAYSPLSMKDLEEVTKLMLRRVAKTVEESQGISIKINTDILNDLARLGYDPVMGARPMERTIQEKIENLLAEKILKGEIKKGDTFTITKEMI